MGVNAARLLRLLPPETAHRLAIRLLDLTGPVPRFARAGYPRLRTSLGGIELPHPVCLAAGFDKNAEAFVPLLRLGFAAVEVGTVTPRPQAGNPRPRLFRLAADRAVVNRLGFNNAGLEAATVRLARRRVGSGAVGANIGMNRDAGDPVADYRRGLEQLYPLVDYLTVNVSSPNTPGLRALQRREGLLPLLEALLSARERLVGAGNPPKPLLLKVAPDLTEDEEAGIAALALELRLDGLVVGNTTVSRPPTLRSGTPARRAA
jgi:dihydroorotate dehydrogenase